MAFHPIPALWFEVLVPRDHVARVMEALARTKRVEFEAADGAETTDLTSLDPWLDEYDRIRQDMAAALPPPDTAMRSDGRMLEAIAEQALGRLRGWAVEAGPGIRALEVAEREIRELATWHDILSHLARLEPGLEFPSVEEPELKLRIRVFELVPGSNIEINRELTVSRLIEARERQFLLAVGTADSIAELTRDMTAHNARHMELPDWARGKVANVRDEAARRLAVGRERAAGIRAGLDAVQRKYGVAAALGDMIRVSWVAREIRHFPVTENLGWIMGWTSARGDEELRRPLDVLDLPYALHFVEPPPGKTPPSILYNPGWARPFEVFARLLGTPSVQEADPSVFLAVIAPLLFGYMFGDVGHGAVLLIAGLTLRRQFPLMGLLVPGGAAAIGFGFLFGEFFASEHLLPALWVRPLEEPLTVLFTPLVAGGVVIALGLVLGGLTALWRRTFGRWLLRELGLLVAYGAIWGALVDTRFLWVTGIGVVWYVAGHLAGSYKPPFASIGQGIGALAENGLRLLVNTISFVRVGAFALAHAGLGVAVVNLASAGGAAGQWPILFIGNLLILIIEGLVVSVQTTRLILFEFFIRFLQATGRPFRPSLPPEWAGERLQSTRNQVT